jgi:hypothetical protein
MSMAAPFDPESARDERGSSVPPDDLLTDADTADGAAIDETVPEDDRLPAGDAAPEDADELEAALASEGPKGLRLPEAGGGLTSDELREDLSD